MSKLIFAPFPVFAPSPAETKKRAITMAIDHGGGQSADVTGVIRALFAMSKEDRRWLAEQLLDPSTEPWPAGDYL